MSTIQFFVKEPQYGKTLVLRLPPTTTLAEFIEKITEQTGWPKRYFYLTKNARPIYSNTEEELHRTLEELQITNETTVVCNGRLHPRD